MNKDEIKCIRKALNLTQYEFGLRLGVARQTVATWEMGIRNPSKAAIILMRSLGGVTVGKSELPE